MIKKRLLALFLLLIVCVVVPIMATLRCSGKMSESQDIQHLTIWQIDSFEGGKGSRASFLSNLSQKCFKGENCYVTVTALSSDAARENLKNDNLPDIISYGSGFYGLESYINATDFAYKTWCRGGYCIITTDVNADFSDVNSGNTAINKGKENLVSIATLLYGLDGGNYLPATSAYVQVIKGKYKYLLGTQRDIFRFKTRGVEIIYKPIEKFNDLYQNISILATDKIKYNLSKKFVEYLLENSDGVKSLGLFCDGKNLYDDSLHAFEETKVTTKLQGPTSENFIASLKQVAESKDINLLKSMLK